MLTAIQSLHVSKSLFTVLLFISQHCCRKLYDIPNCFDTGRWLIPTCWDKHDIFCVGSFFWGKKPVVWRCHLATHVVIKLLALSDSPQHLLLVERSLNYLHEVLFPNTKIFRIISRLVVTSRLYVVGLFFDCSTIVTFLKRLPQAALFIR